MQSTTSDSTLGASTSEHGVIIAVGGADPDDLITARLLACVASPPSSEGDERWHELVRAFVRLMMHQRQREDPAWFERQQVIVPNHLIFPLERAERLTSEAMAQVNCALGAVHALMPALVRALAISRGEPLSRLPSAWRRERPLTKEIDRVLTSEAEFRDFLEDRGETVPLRFPDIESTNATGNFRSRVIAPFRPSLHLAAGLAQVLDAVERELLEDAGEDRSEWARLQLGEYPASPRLRMEALLRLPEIAIAAINKALALEAALPFLEVQRPAPEIVVRLRWVTVAPDSASLT